MPKGRKKQNTATNMEVISVNKEAMLEDLSREKALPITQDVIDKFDIKPVGRLSRLSGGKYIKGFSEKTYEQSLRAAYAWRDRQNVANGHVIELVSYFPQVHRGKSVLVSYNILSKDDTRDG